MKFQEMNEVVAPSDAAFWGGVAIGVGIVFVIAC
jgi:hypothetical protein